MLEQLDGPVTTAGAQPPRRPCQRDPLPRADRLEEQDLAARLLDRDPRRNHPCVVHDRESADEVRQLAEDMVRDVAGRARDNEQARLVAPLGGMLRDQLRWQVVVELAGIHPTRTLASASMNELREALRDGLREEAAPISRRLAEVKGLSNNAIRRLDGIEQTLASERDARIDDLTLLVEMLTEGWRSLNTKLDRIEAALEHPQNVVPLRSNVAG